jgi:hypothetical protein
LFTEFKAIGALLTLLFHPHEPVNPIRDSFHGAISWECNIRANNEYGKKDSGATEIRRDKPTT